MAAEQCRAGAPLSPGAGGRAALHAAPGDGRGAAGALTELYDHAAAALGNVPPRRKKALHVSEVSSNAIHCRS